MRTARLRAHPAGRPHELVRLTSRLIFAQAGMTAAIGLAFTRRNLPWLLVTLLLAALLALVAVAVRTAAHGAWAAAVAFEAAFVIIGLYRFFFARYLGGTLLGLGALAFLLHPAVGRVFAAPPAGARGRVPRPRADPLAAEHGDPEQLGRQPG